jgi:hypothetical protein
MAEQTTLDVLKQQTIDYVKLQLGDGMIDLELDPEHYEAAYQRAIGVYRQRATNAYEESYNFLEIKEDVNVYTLPDEVESVRQIFRRTIGNIQGPYSSSFDPFSSATLNIYLLNYNYAGGLASYDFYTQYVEQAARMFGGYVNYTFNPATKQLQIVRDPRGEGEVFLLWTYNLRPEIQVLKDRMTSQWIRDYMIGNCKLMIGEAREKFATIAGPQGGTALNGAAMKAEGQQIMDSKIEELKNYVDGSQPLTWVIG